MQYSVLNNKIVIEDSRHFIPEHILDCGQVFRYCKTKTGYKIFSKNLFCGLIYENSRVIIETSDTDYFINYFDLNRDYGNIKQSLLVYPQMAEPIRYGSGIRILNQDAAEMIFSFIISANNNIPRIKLIIERLCQALGENMGEYMAFPTAEALASQNESFYKSMGAGYRASYLAITAKMLHDGFSLDISNKDYNQAKKYLMQLKGVGPKVADCILLFGYHLQEAFPTDVWIERAYKYLFGETSLSRVAQSQALSAHFGSLSGYAQQYLFYYMRGNYK